MRSEEEIRAIYNRFVEDVERREEKLEHDIPELDECIGVSDMLLRPPKTWEEGDKSLRTLPVLDAYREEIEGVSKETKELLVGLDANINVLDDIIDTRTLEKHEKVELTANTAFSALLAYRNVPEEHAEEFSQMALQYLTELFQIPLVERETIETIESTEDRKEVIEAAKRAYSYRARDIDVFAKAPALLNNLSTTDEERISEDLRTFRAKQLVVKDVHDVERDLEDRDITPVIKIMESYEESEAFHIIKNIISSFQYSDEGDESYAEALSNRLKPFDEQLVTRKKKAVSVS